jgi:hypothetical protein
MSVGYGQYLIVEGLGSTPNLRVPSKRCIREQEEQQLGDSCCAPFASQPRPLKPSKLRAREGGYGSGMNEG